MHELRQFGPFARIPRHKTQFLAEMNSTTGLTEEYVTAAPQHCPLERHCSTFILQCALNERAICEGGIVQPNLGILKSTMGDKTIARSS